jgi:hypothetical protein
MPGSEGEDAPTLAPPMFARQKACLNLLEPLADGPLAL